MKGKGKGGVGGGEKSLRCGRGVVSLRWCGIIESDVKFILLVHKKQKKDRTNKSAWNEMHRLS